MNRFLSGRIRWREIPTIVTKTCIVNTIKIMRIGGYDVRRVMVDQGSAAEIMYPDLFKGLGLKPEDLSAYSSPLVSFEGRTVIPRGQIRLPV